MFLDPIDYRFQVFHYVRLRMSDVMAETVQAGSISVAGSQRHNLNTLYFTLDNIIQLIYLLKNLIRGLEL